ncbi:hypothetical protein KIPB_002842 [Kipferlia bialata]|uniref:Uncharacterized protein n=1 Tax=Kipferlia bialata TaxID=797122 RepID=A0A391NUM2_9EUKA|nr:hypothetical protein KIPB_002842 [Kipferlia bialata]|eukprot:g2842.t1
MHRVLCDACGPSPFVLSVVIYTSPYPRCANCVFMAIGEDGAGDDTATRNEKTFKVQMTAGGQLGGYEVEESGLAMLIDTNLALFGEINVFTEDCDTAISMESSAVLTLVSTGDVYTDALLKTDGDDKVTLTTAGDIEAAIDMPDTVCGYIVETGTDQEIVIEDFTEFSYLSSDAFGSSDLNSCSFMAVEITTSGDVDIEAAEDEE